MATLLSYEYVFLLFIYLMLNELYIICNCHLFVISVKFSHLAKVDYVDLCMSQWLCCLSLAEEVCQDFNFLIKILCYNSSALCSFQSPNKSSNIASTACSLQSKYVYPHWLHVRTSNDETENKNRSVDHFQQFYLDKCIK